MTKDGRLFCRWSKRHGDFLISYPSGSDGYFLYGLISHYEKLSSGRTLLEELELRGYDTKTLRIQVDKKAPTLTMAPRKKKMRRL